MTRREIRKAIPPTPEVLELGKRIAPYRRIFLVNTIGETLFIEWLRTVAPQMVNFKKGSVLIGSKKVGDIRQLFYIICRGLLEIIRGIPPPENLQRKITSKANIIYRKKFYQKCLYNQENSYDSQNSNNGVHVCVAIIRIVRVIYRLLQQNV